MLTSKPRQLHVRKVPWYGDLLPGSWRSGMPRCPPTTLRTWPCLEYGTDVQTGLQFAVPLFLPAWGRIVKAQAPDFSSSPPVLIVSWLEVSVLSTLGSWFWLSQSVAPVASPMLEYFLAVAKQQMYRPKYPQKNTFSSGRIFHQFFPCEIFSWYWRNCLDGEWSITGILEVRELRQEQCVTVVFLELDFYFSQFDQTVSHSASVFTRVCWGLIY